MFLHLFVSHSVHMGVYSPKVDTPWADTHWQTPPLGRHSPGQTLPGRHHLGRHPLGRHPQQTPLWVDTPSPPRWPLQQIVCILLDCILVYLFFSFLAFNTTQKVESLSVARVILSFKTVHVCDWCILYVL